MSNLAGLPPLGQKQPSVKQARRKAIRRLSAKRAAYLASPRAFYAAHGDSKTLLAKVADALADELNPT